MRIEPIGHFYMTRETDIPDIARHFKNQVYKFLNCNCYSRSYVVISIALRGCVDPALSGLPTSLYLSYPAQYTYIHMQFMCVHAASLLAQTAKHKRQRTSLLGRTMRLPHRSLILLWHDEGGRCPLRAVDTLEYSALYELTDFTFDGRLVCFRYRICSGMNWLGVGLQLYGNWSHVPGA